jgi:nucleoside-diphosphate-sugar epimerase
MKVMVTGAAGFLGSTLCKRLFSEGWDVVGVDLMHHADAWRLKELPLDYQWLALQDIHEVPPYIVHTASVTDVGYASRSPINAVNQTVLGTVGLMEAARRNSHIERVVVIVSHSVYGSVERQPVKEDELLRPRNLYGAVKAAQEQVAMSYWYSYQIPVTVVRSSIMFGEFERTGALVSLFLSRSMRGDPIVIHGDGSQTRDMNYVQNTVDGILKVLLHDKAVGEAFNVGSGDEVSVRQLASLCIQLTESKSEIMHVDSRQGEEGRMALDITKAREILGYEAKISLYEGLARTADWLAKRGVVAL